MKHLIAPSVLAADFTKLADEIALVNQSEADWFHVDVMDGMFVPNISFGFPVIKAIKKYAKKPLDVHLMIENPDRYLQIFKDAGADILSVHIEACPHLHRTIQAIKKGRRCSYCNQHIHIRHTITNAFPGTLAKKAHTYEVNRNGKGQLYPMIHQPVNMYTRNHVQHQ